MKVAIAFAPAQIPDFTPPTPLIGAVLGNNTAQVKQILFGVNPKKISMVAGPSVGTAASETRHGPGPDHRRRGDSSKQTMPVALRCLTRAADNESPDLALVPMLLNPGADPKAKNKKGAHGA